jgi:hypothetical protein
MLRHMSYPSHSSSAPLGPLIEIAEVNILRLNDKAMLRITRKAVNHRGAEPLNVRGEVIRAAALIAISSRDRAPRVAVHGPGKHHGLLSAQSADGGGKARSPGMVAST